MSSVTNFHFQPTADTFGRGLAMIWLLLPVHANLVCICMKLTTLLKLSYYDFQIEIGLPYSLGFVVNIFPGKRCPNFVAFGQDELKLYSE